MKFVKVHGLRRYKKSRPARGAWVEISKQMYGENGQLTSRPARGAWVEIIPKIEDALAQCESRPARGAWVEIKKQSRNFIGVLVAPRKGRVG